MPEFKVAFWNLQNLFDTSVSDIAADFKYTPEFGWDDSIKKQKINNLSEIINGMFNGTGPDLLGICEVENVNVANELIASLNRNDLILAHIDSPDIRGIDCSLIFSKDLFDLVEPPKGHLIHLRYPTRDIFEVKLKVKSNNAELVVLVNHWPSRSRGRYESEPYRITVASQCGKIVDDHLKLNRVDYLNKSDSQNTLNEINDLWNQNILLMGDFNDEPYDRSVLQELKSSKGNDKIEEVFKKVNPRDYTPTVESYLKKQAYLYNCSWVKSSLPDVGTYHFSPSVNTMNMLDQIIVSRGLLYGEKGLKVSRDNNNLPQFEIYTPVEMRTSNNNVRPKKFTFKTEGNGNVKNNDGYSDHFPVCTVIETI